MEALHALTKPIDKPEKLREQLENLQGNILRGHGRSHAVHIFLQFKDGKQAKVERWINRFAARITSAQQQLEEAKQYRQYKIPGRLFLSFFLSARGYAYLGLAFPNTSHADHQSTMMEQDRLRLNDPPKKDWEEGYRKTIHALVLLAADNEPSLLGETRRLLDRVKRYAEICIVEHGKVMRNAQGNAVEHFGYVDGRSQPLFFRSDIEREQQEGDSTHIWDPSAGPNLVLAPDPYGRKEWTSDGKVRYRDSGSYLVFRKLEQNVRGFKGHAAKLAKTLGLTGSNAQRAAALVMGRFEDGTPVVLQSTASQPAPIPNNFTYNADPHGQKCPLHAHIRKVNPRQDKSRRIVRRGITYGTRMREPKDNPSLEELPSEGVGLLFMCYQRNIQRQFQFLQHNWANEPGFPPEQEPAGIDPVIGQLKPPVNINPVTGQSEVPEAGQQKWPVQWGDPRKDHKHFDFYSFVKFKGGEYFFAPSLYFLKNLGKKEG